MNHKLIFRMNGQTFTVFKNQNEIARLLMVDGVELVSVNQEKMDFVSSAQQGDMRLKHHVSRQRKLQREKRITVRQLAKVAGVSENTVQIWLNQEDTEHYQKIVSLIEQIEERR